ncbi:uncharacterized protein LOC115718031 isoform X1 [Cannabis sativa]|uniref:uncharacterized protein LOC115718031 isoform X1 n=2 Tax=Cannabis sativa TaxID=3483 RepID=UPI0029C9FE17|nr:uncharacterized protein LOC115718031 isoform X1 [Cannabis sativa]
MQSIKMSANVANYHGGDGDGDDPLDSTGVPAACETSGGESRKGRGKNVLVNLEERRKKAGVSLPLEVDNVSNKIVGLESKTFPRLIGREITLHVPGHYSSWENVPEQFEHLILTKLKHYYQMDSNPKLIAISIAEMAEKYKTRKNIRLAHFKKYYQNPEDFENAVKNPPNELSEEQWRLICQLFTTSEFIQRSKENALNRQKMKYSSTQGSITMAKTLHQNQEKSYIETWKDCHTKKGTHTFINEAAKNKYEEMVITRNSAPESSQVSKLEILRQTLGERRAHQRGVGRKLKGQSSGRHSQPATTDQPDLQEIIVEMQKQIQMLTQQLSRERREPIDVEMNDAAPTQPMRPQLSGSQMPGDGFGPSFQPMGFHHQQPQHTPISFQQLLQQPPVPLSASLTPEQFHSQMYQSYLQFLAQSPKNLQVVMNMMMQLPQTSHVSQSRMPQMMPTQHMSQMPQNVQMMSTEGQQYQQTSQTMSTQPWQQTSQTMPTQLGQQTSQTMPTQQGQQYQQTSQTMSTQPWQQTSQIMPTQPGQQTSQTMPTQPGQKTSQTMPTQPGQKTSQTMPTPHGQ